MRDLLLAVSPGFRLVLPILASVAASFVFGALLPDDWPLIAYLLAGFPLGAVGALIGIAWKRMEES